MEWTDAILLVQTVNNAILNVLQNQNAVVVGVIDQITPHARTAIGTSIGVVDQNKITLWHF